MINNKKCAVVFGAGGFIGSHLAYYLRNHKGYYVIGADIKLDKYGKTHWNMDNFFQVDLRDPDEVEECLNYNVDEVYQLAADMGGAGYIFSGENDADVMDNSVTINLNVLDKCYQYGIQDIFYSSSACVYPEHNQEDPDNPNCEESSAYPANPDSEYGWEKLFSERLYFSYNRNYGMNCKVARFHNIFGPHGSWNNGREKAPAAICRKVAEAPEGGSVDVWGTGEQTRSFLYIDDCVRAISQLMDTPGFNGPVNIGSERMISIKDFTQLVTDISGKDLSINFVDGPTGVNGRNSDNRLIEEKIGWEPQWSLEEGIKETYRWIENNIKNGIDDR